MVLENRPDNTIWDDKNLKNYLPSIEDIESNKWEIIYDDIGTFLEGIGV